MPWPAESGRAAVMASWPARLRPGRGAPGRRLPGEARRTRL